jgi:DNA repair protein RadC
MKNSYTMHDLPPSERPRERLARLGTEALSTQEILAIILGRGIKGEPVMALANNLLSSFGNLNNLANATLIELSKIKGIGLAKGTQIKAAFELGKRLDNSFSYSIKEHIKSPEDVIKEIRNNLKGKKKEHFMALFLDTRNHPIETRTISIGSLDSSIVHPRELFKEAISHSAASIILVHNHPSGDTEPSDEDVQLTKRLIEAGEVLGIEILDHIVISDNSHLSMKSKGLI